MKTKNMRKKALLSSVAMLLVAVVALSGATYAWFTANGQGNVSGIKLKATQAQSLKFCSSNSQNEAEWLTDWDFNYTNEPIIVPCSTTNGVDLYTVTASSAAVTGDIALNTLVSSINEATAYDPDNNALDNGDYIEEVVYVKSGNGGALQISDVDFTGTLTNLRCSIEVADAGSAKIFSAASTGSTSNKGLLPGAADEQLPADTTFTKLYNGGTGYENIVGTQTIYGNGETIISDLGNGATKLTIRVWLEGNNTNCTDALAGKQMTAMEIDFTLA